MRLKISRWGDASAEDRSQGKQTERQPQCGLTRNRIRSEAVANILNLIVGSFNIETKVSLHSINVTEKKEKQEKD